MSDSQDNSSMDSVEQLKEDLPTAAKYEDHPTMGDGCSYLNRSVLEDGDELVTRSDAEQEIADAIKESYSNGKRIGKDKMRRRVLSRIDQRIEEWYGCSYEFSDENLTCIEAGAVLGRCDNCTIRKEMESLRHKLREEVEQNDG